MDMGLIARRYATVLLEFARDKGVIDQVYEDSRLVRCVLNDEPDAMKFFNSPLHKMSEKRALVAGTFTGKVTSEMLQFLNFLVEKERVGLAPQVLLVFESLVKKEKKVVTAVVTTATELSQDAQKGIIDQIDQKLRHSGVEVSAVEASFKSDPKIIGGIILQIDGRQADSSIASKLAEIERALRCRASVGREPHAFA